ncbi:hypothetical protein ACF5W4_10410 [Bacillota bacterium Lsc_1132]
MTEPEIVNLAVGKPRARGGLAEKINEITVIVSKILNLCLTEADQLF